MPLVAESSRAGTVHRKADFTGRHADKLETTVYELAEDFGLSPGFIAVRLRKYGLVRARMAEAQGKERSLGLPGLRPGRGLDRRRRSLGRSQVGRPRGAGAKRGRRPRQPAADGARGQAALGLARESRRMAGMTDWTEAELAALEASGIEALVTTAAEGRRRRHDFRPTRAGTAVKKAKADWLREMANKLDCEEGRALYRLRQQTVEPVFGVIKAVLGFTRFSLRGLDKVAGEWDLVALAYNCKRLHKLTLATAS